MNLPTNDENIALLAVTSACCEALGKEVQPAFLADEIEALRKRLADAALVEAELHSRIHANDTFLLTIAGPAFDREQLRTEAKLILGVK